LKAREPRREESIGILRNKRHSIKGKNAFEAFPEASREEGWREKRPERSRSMVSAGMAKSSGILPGEVMLGEGRSSTRWRVMFSKFNFKKGLSEMQLIG